SVCSRLARRPGRHRRARRGSESGRRDQPGAAGALRPDCGGTTLMADGARKLVQQIRGDEAESSTPVDVNARSMMLIVIAAAAAMFVLQWASEVFIPIVLSVLISCALEPIVVGLIRLRLPRMLASGLVVASMAGTFGYTGYALSDDAAAIVASLPDAAVKLRQALRHGKTSAIESVNRAAQELQKTADEAAGKNPAPSGVQRVQIEEPTIDVKQDVSWGSASVIAFAGQAVL